MDDGYDELCRMLVAQLRNNDVQEEERGVACACADYLDAFVPHKTLTDALPSNGEIAIKSSEISFWAHDPRQVARPLNQPLN